MKISIVTVCRNAADSLEKTIRSVISQDYKDIDFVVVDGASTDRTPEIIDRYKEYISASVSEKDKGIYDAMNKGVRMASGEWVIFMNAADRFADNSVVSRLAAEAENTDTGVLYGSVIKGDYSNPECVEITKEAETPHNSHRMIFCHQSSMTKRELLLEHPFDIRHSFSADFKFFKTLLKTGVRFKKLDFPIARFDTGGISNRKRSTGLADNMKVILEVDGIPTGLPHLLHLLPTWLICRIQGK